jgi:hypothetical protein
MTLISKYIVFEHFEQINAKFGGLNDPLVVFKEQFVLSWMAYACHRT